MSWPALVALIAAALAAGIAVTVLAVKLSNRTQALARARGDLARARVQLEKAALLMVQLENAARQKELPDADAVDAMLRNLADLRFDDDAGGSPGPDHNP